MGNDIAILTVGAYSFAMSFDSATHVASILRDVAHVTRTPDLLAFTGASSRVLLQIDANPSFVHPPQEAK